MGGLSLLVAHVGKPRLPFIRQGIEHFRLRIQSLATIRLMPLREEPLRKGTSPLEVQGREQARILKVMDRRCQWVALDEHGRRADSREFAALLEAWMFKGRSRVSFLVAGPCGLSPEVLNSADLRLSVSPMTFSHEMTLLVLLEQLYRALAILNRLPYPR